jgi:hypothetical protein
MVNLSYLFLNSVSQKSSQHYKKILRKLKITKGKERVKARARLIQRRGEVEEEEEDDDEDGDEDCYLYSINEKFRQAVVGENEDVAEKDDAPEKERELEETRNLRKRIPKVHSEYDFNITANKKKI